MKNIINFMFKLQLLVKVIRLKFVNLFRENVVKVVSTFEVSLQVTFIGQLSKQQILLYWSHLLST